jgi:regulator of RNase E activity RraB
VTFIFLSNYTDIPFQQVTTDVINILDNKEYEIPHKIDRIEIQVPTEILKKYTGKFALEADLTQTFSIELIDNKLFQVDTNGDKFQLHPDSETTFFESPNTKDGFIFTLNEQSNEYELTIVSGGINLKMTTQKE